MFKFIRTTMLWIILTPLAFTFTGALSNQVVLAANHDCFPVMINSAKQKDFTEQGAPVIDGITYLDDTHIVMTKYTHLNFLADWIDLKEAIYSPGDMLLELGDWSGIFMPFVWGALVIKKLHEE